MEDIKNKKIAFEDGETIDLGQIFKTLWRKVWIIATAGILAAIVFLSYSLFMITPKYSSGVMMYVNNNNSPVSGGNISISTTNISAARSLVETYIVILKNRATLDKVIARSGVDYEYEELVGMISAAPVQDTEVFEVTVTTEDPAEAAKIANTIAEVLPGRLSEVIEGSSVRLVQEAIESDQKVSPNVTKNTLLGFLLGIFAACAVIVVIFLLDDTIYNEEYILQTYDIPVLAKIPNLITEEKAGYGYKKGYGNYGNSNRTNHRN